MKKSYGLTFPQKNIWLVDRVNHNTPINVIVGIINIKNGFREDVCDKAINKFIEENEGIRLKLKLDGEEPIQYVSEYKYKKIEDVDLSESSKEQISDFLSGNALHPFSLLEDDLYDFKIVRTGDDSGLIFIKLHHMVCDAWSYSQLGKQIMENYEKIINGMDLEEKVVPSYIEFIETEREYSKSEKCTKDKEFFEEYLRDLKDPVSLKEAISNTTSASRKSFILSDEENEKINKYCKDNKVSPYALFLAALSTYIYRIKDVKDFVIGTPVLNRSGFKEKQMLGMFVSTLPLRIKIEENEKFLDVIKNISRDTMSLFRHQRYPYSKTLEYVHKNTDIKTNLFNLSLSYQNARIDLPNEDRFSTDWIFNENISDQLQIHIMDMDSTGKLNIHYDYLKELFLDEEIGYIHTRLMSIIYNAIDDIDVDVEKIRIMSVEEENRILYDFNNTKVDYPKDKTVIDLFEEQVKKNSDKVALVFENKTMTYGELNKRVNSLAYYLSNVEKIQKRDSIALMLNRGFDMIISILAIFKIGAVYLPIDVEFPEDRISYVINDSNARFAITNVNNNNISISKLEINKFEYENYYGKDITTSIDIEDPAYIIYTSGTTGKPKGVIIKHENLLNLVYAIKDAKNIDNCGFALSMSKYSFDMFVIETLVMFLLGNPLVLANDEESITPKQILELVYTNKVKIMFITPTKLNLLFQIKDYHEKIATIKKLTVAAERFPAKILDELKDFDMEIFNGYGPTECTVCSTVKKVESKEDINIGKPISNVTCYIMDIKQRLLPIGTKGELCIGGKCVSEGYIDSKLNKSFFIKNKERLYRTGDICSFLPNGDVQYFSRNDNQIKINGIRVELSEIDKVINSLNYVSSSYISVKNNNIILYVVLKETTKELLQKELNKVLPRYMRPTKIYVVDAIPFNSNGKVDLKKLQEIEERNDRGINTEELKLDSRAKKILDIYSKYTSISEEDLNSGLDSLDIIKISMELENEFDLNVSVKELYQCSNVSDVIYLINKSTSCCEEEIENNNLHLNSSQISVLNEYLINPDNVLYNIPFEIVLDKKIDIKKLKYSLETVINKYDALFYNIKFEAGHPIWNKMNKKFSITETNVSNSEYEKIKDNFVRPYDILNDRLFRIELYITEKNVCILFDFCHISFDGASFQLLLSDLEKVYNKDEISDRRKIYNYEKNNESSKQFFLDMLSGEIPKTKLYSNKFSSNLTDNGEKVHKKLDLEDIEKYCKDKNITVNNLILAALNIVLAKYTYNEDVLIGTAISGRNRIDLVDKIGMYVKVLPYRINIDYENSIQEYIEKVQNLTLNILDNSDCNYNELLNEVKNVNFNSRNPLYSIVYVYQNKGIEEIVLGGKKGKLSAIESNKSKYDITFEVIPTKGNLIFNVEYNSDLYEKGTIELFIEHVINVINQILAGKATQLKDIDMITKEEKNKILNEFNDTTTDYPRDKTVIEFFEENVAKFPDKKAIICNGYYLTYKQLNEKCNKLANYLIKRGVKNQEVVGILMDRSVEFYIAMIAVLKCNAIFTTVIEDIPDERAKYMFDNASVNKVITTKKFDRKKLEYEKILIDLDNEIYVNESEENLAIRGKATDIVHVIYTSGTTGLPKGNMITNRGMVRMLVNTNYVDFTSNDISITTSSLTFDTSTFENYGNLIYGMTWHVFTKEQVMNFDLFRKYIRDNGITTTFVPTPIFNQMLEYDNSMFDTLKYIYVGGDSFLLKNANIVYNRPCTVYNMYGPAENSVMSSFYKINKYHITNIPIGYLNSNSNGYIYDKCGKLCPINVPGDLYVGGDGLAVGYINKPELTKEKFVYVDELGKRVYKTGDLTLWNSDGSIQFLGRIDSQIKIRGQRIELLEIQNKMLELPQLKEVAIKCFEDNKKNKYLVAYYTSNAEISEHNIKEFLNKYLPSYMIPSRIIMLNEMPLNQNGKIDYKKLPEVKLKNNEDLILPKNKEQEKILNVFKYTLAREDIGMNSDYFENGGDSLSVVNLISQFKNVGIDILYADIFKYKTPIDIYNYLYEEEEQTSISENIKDFDYSKINKLIAKNKNVEFDTKQIGNVLLTGVTGFLGVHVLEELVESGVEKVYCLIRNKNDINITERFDKHLKFFFTKAKVEKIKERTVLINGDLTKDNILADSLEDLDITTVINCAARVAHYGDLAKFEEINVDGVNNLIKYCLKNNKELIHISTLSVSGNLLEGGQIIQKNIKDGTIFDETKLFVGQDLDNVYVYTKYLAEKNILDNIVNNGLNAKIIRVGNLTGRYRDGKFQPNVEENAFSGRIKSIIKLRVIPENLLNLYLEMTPIDYAAKAIVKLSRITSENTIFHLFNDNHAYVPFVMDCFKDLGIDLKIISKKEMKNILDKEIKENIDKVSGLISDIGKSGMLEYNTNITVKSDITKQILEKLQFKWPKVTTEYFKKYINYLKDIGYIEF